MENWKNLKMNSEKMINNLLNRKTKISEEIQENQKILKLLQPLKVKIFRI